MKESSLHETLSCAEARSKFWELEELDPEQRGRVKGHVGACDACYYSLTEKYAQKERAETTSISPDVIAASRSVVSTFLGVRQMVRYEAVFKMLLRMWVLSEVMKGRGFRDLRSPSRWPDRIDVSVAEVSGDDEERTVAFDIIKPPSIDKKGEFLFILRTTRDDLIKARVECTITGEGKALLSATDEIASNGEVALSVSGLPSYEEDIPEIEIPVEHIFCSLVRQKEEKTPRIKDRILSNKTNVTARPELAGGYELGELNERITDLYRPGRYDEAIDIALETVKRARHALGEEHPGVATSLSNVAGLYRSIGNYAEALPLYEQALAIRRKACGEEHPAVAESLSDLAVLRQAMGNYAEALPLCEQALALRRKMFGENHLEVVTSLNNLAMIYRLMRKYDASLPLYEKALRIRRHILGRNI